MGRFRLWVLLAVVAGTVTATGCLYEREGHGYRDRGERIEGHEGGWHENGRHEEHEEHEDHEGHDGGEWH